MGSRRGRDSRPARRLEPADPPIRQRIEKIFGTWKRSYGLRRMRWRGMAKATLLIHLTAIAYNLKRAMAITTVA
ncbi:transposase [Rhodoplanes sp. SY1]|uniref:transposase n=1 Tax=Rhodoplanes sp. SY1 TaxID=3166646 RepID=UPI0038B5C931